MKRSFLHYLLLIAALLCSCSFLATLGLANPNSQKPNRPLGAHGTIPGAKETAAQLYELYNKNELMVIEFASKKDRPDRYPYRQLQSAGGDLWKAVRDVQRLKLMGEPASSDLSQKLHLVRVEVGKLAIAYRSTLPGAKQHKKNLDQLRKKKPSTDKRLEKISQTIKAGRNLEQSEKELEQIGVEIHGLAVIFSPKEAMPFVKNVTAVLGELDTKLQPQRRSQYANEAKKAIAQNQRMAATFATEATRVRTEMATGKVVIGDVTEAGAPEAIAHLVDEWGKASAALIRNTAIQWAFTRTSPSKINSTQMAAVSRLNSAARDAVIGVIQAATVTAEPEAIPQLHADIMRELSRVDRRSIGSGLSKDCEPALGRLAAKSPTLPPQIAAYKRATRQPLIWRERFAKESAKNLRNSYINAQALFGMKEVPTATNKPEIFGRLSKTKRVLLSKTLSGVASWKVFEAATTTIGKRVSEDDTLRLYPGSLTSLVRHKNVHYANIAVGMPVQREIEDLKSCLLISDEHPALSFMAADAIATAQREDYMAVGGEVSRLHLEAALTRFIALPDIAYQLAPLGALPQILDDAPAIEQACWRLDIAPHWIQHRYFTVAIREKLPR